MSTSVRALVLVAAIAACHPAEDAGGALGGPQPARADDETDRVAAPDDDEAAMSRADAPGLVTSRGVVLLPRNETAVAYQRRVPDRKLSGWRERVPGIETISIRSSIDGSTQRALWHPPRSREPRPLLVVLHSWSADYRHNVAIPFAELAVANDWAFIHPDFRGPNRRPSATASELAIQDVLDAVGRARELAAIDPSRVYLTGYSGGAMKALVLAGRHPELWAGVAAWGAIYDIPKWYEHNRARGHERYVREIAASCGGPPRPESAAFRECVRRSPSAHIAGAKDRVPILIGHGIRDRTVPPTHALDAYDALAEEDDRFREIDRVYIARARRVPPSLEDYVPRQSTLFDAAGARLHLERRSGAVTLLLYDGGHDMLYNPTFEWLSAQRRE